MYSMENINFFLFHIIATYFFCSLVQVALIVSTVISDFYDWYNILCRKYI